MRRYAIQFSRDPSDKRHRLHAPEGTPRWFGWLADYRPLQGILDKTVVSGSIKNLRWFSSRKAAESFIKKNDPHTWDVDMQSGVWIEWDRTVVAHADVRRRAK